MVLGRIWHTHDRFGNAIAAVTSALTSASAALPAIGLGYAPGDSVVELELPRFHLSKQSACRRKSPEGRAEEFIAAQSLRGSDLRGYSITVNPIKMQSINDRLRLTGTCFGAAFASFQLFWRNASATGIRDSRIPGSSAARVLAAIPMSAAPTTILGTVRI
jgi:hypothetical protein